MTKNTKTPKTHGDKIKAAPTKAEMIISLLRRKAGASTSELAEATGWQAHSVRGFMFGSLKKKLGPELNFTKEDNKERRYRIEAVAQ